METKAIQAAITTIENQLEVLKASCGLSPDVGEGEAEGHKEEVADKLPSRRGRHKAMPRFEKEDD